MSDDQNRFSLEQDGHGYWRILVKGPRGGTQRIIRTPTKAYSEALRILAGYIERGGSGDDLYVGTIDELVTAWRAGSNKGTGRKDGSSTAVRYISQKVGSIKIPHDQGGAQATLAAAYQKLVEGLRADAVPTSSARLTAAYFRSAVKYAQLMAIIPPVNLPRAMFGQKVIAVERRALKPEEVAKLFEAAKVLRLTDRLNHRKIPRLLIALHLMYWTGCRVGAAAALTWRQVDFEERTIDYRPLYTGMTKKGALVPMSKRTYEFLREVKEKNPKTLYVACYNKDTSLLADECRDLMRSLGINGVRVHDIRTTRLTGLLAAGVPIHKAAAMLGHSVYVAQTVYNQLSNSPEYLRAAVEDADEFLAKGISRDEEQ